MSNSKYVMVTAGEHAGKIGLLETNPDEENYLVYFDYDLGNEYDIIHHQNLVYALPEELERFKELDPVRAGLLGIV